MPGWNHFLFQLQLSRLEQLLGGVSSLPKTSVDLYWSSMHSSVALRLRHERCKMVAGTSSQRAMEGMLMHFWAQVHPDITRGVAIMQNHSIMAWSGLSYRTKCYKMQLRSTQPFLC